MPVPGPSRPGHPPVGGARQTPQTARADAAPQQVRQYRVRARGCSTSPKRRETCAPNSGWQDRGSRGVQTRQTDRSGRSSLTGMRQHQCRAPPPHPRSSGRTASLPRPPHPPQLFLRAPLPLPHRVLGVRHTVAANTATGEIGHRRDITSSPGIHNSLILVTDPEISTNPDSTTLFDGQVTRAHNARVRHRTGGPDDEIRRNCITRGQLNNTVNRALHLRIEVNLCSTLSKVLNDLETSGERYLGHDPPHRLDEVKVNLFKRNLRVVLEQCGCERA